jgi:hypothetical protein
VDSCGVLIAAATNQLCGNHAPSFAALPPHPKAKALPILGQPAGTLARQLHHSSKEGSEHCFTLGLRFIRAPAGMV